MPLRDFRIEDGDRLRTFWLACGIKIRPGDDDRALAAFGERNPGLFLIEEDRGRIVASGLAGWDGRRGWLYHVAVHPEERRRGLGRAIVTELERRLRERGCPKVNLIVWGENTYAMRFWEAVGYSRAATVEYEKQL